MNISLNNNNQHNNLYSLDFRLNFTSDLSNLVGIFIKKKNFTTLNFSSKSADIYNGSFPKNTDSFYNLDLDLIQKGLIQSNKDSSAFMNLSYSFYNSANILIMPLRHKIFSKAKNPYKIFYRGWDFRHSLSLRTSRIHSTRYRIFTQILPTYFTSFGQRLLALSWSRFVSSFTLLREAPARRFTNLAKTYDFFLNNSSKANGLSRISSVAGGVNFLLKKRLQLKFEKELYSFFKFFVKVRIYNIWAYAVKTKRLLSIERSVITQSLFAKRLGATMVLSPMAVFSLVQLMTLSFKVFGTMQFLVDYLAILFKRIRKHWALFDSLQIIFESYLRKAKEYIHGCALLVSGKLNGNMRKQKRVMRLGSATVYSIDEHVEFAFAQSFSVFGIFGIKLWVRFSDVSMFNRIPEVVNAAKTERRKFRVYDTSVQTDTE